jgi:hypothetical protein
MENRICISGVWYVRETETTPPQNTININPESVTHTISCEWESDNWAFEATMICREDDPTDFYPDPTIDITDKRGEYENWIKHDSDNPNWMFGVLNNDPESMPDAHAMFDAQGLAEFKAFLEYLIEKGWLIK